MNRFIFLLSLKPHARKNGFNDMMGRKSSAFIIGAFLVGVQHGVQYARAFSSTFSSSTIFKGTPIFARDSVIANKYGLNLIREEGDNTCPPPPSVYLSLMVKDGKLQIEQVEQKETTRETPFSIDFLSARNRRRGANINKVASESIVKAVGGLPRKLGGGEVIDSSSGSNIIWDFTAGLGRDSFILASTGYTVTMFERNTIIHALLADALDRLSNPNPNPHPQTLLAEGAETEKIYIHGIRKRLSLKHIDVTTDHKELANMANTEGFVPPHAIILDPMYEKGQLGAKAKVKKETQFLHRILGLEEGASKENNKLLFTTAMKYAGKRVVVKRPASALPLAGATPHSTISSGTATRYDLYFPNRPVIFT